LRFPDKFLTRERFDNVPVLTALLLSLPLRKGGKERKEEERGGDIDG
jgi:hypothetical protein